MSLLKCAFLEVRRQFYGMLFAASRENLGTMIVGPLANHAQTAFISNYLSVGLPDPPCLET